MLWAQEPTFLPTLPEDVLPNLKPLLQAALKQSPTMLTASLSVATADANALNDRSGLWPNFSGNGQYVYTEEANSADKGSRTTTSGPTYGLSLKQPVFQWGALKHQADFGYLRASIARHQYDEAYRNLALNVRAQYMDLIKKKIGLKIVRNQAQAAQDLLNLQEARFHDGRISSSELLDPRLQVKEAALNLDRMTQDYDASRQMLAHLAGVADVSDSQIPDEIPQPPFDQEKSRPLFERTSQQSLQNTFLFQIYRDSIKEEELNYKIQKVRLYPKFSLFGNYTQLNQTNVDNNGVPTLTAITVATVGIGADWTIFDGFSTRAQIRVALTAKRLAEQQLKEYSENTLLSLRNLEKQIGFAGRLMDLTETRRQMAHGAIERVAEDVKAGVVPQSSLTAISQSADNAALSAVSARAEFLSLWAQYLSTAGVDPVLENLPAIYSHHVK